MESLGEYNNHQSKYSSPQEIRSYDYHCPQGKINGTGVEIENAIGVALDIYVEEATKMMHEEFLKA